MKGRGRGRPVVQCSQGHSRTQRERESVEGGGFLVRRYRTGGRTKRKHEALGRSPGTVRSRLGDSGGSDYGSGGKSNLQEVGKDTRGDRGRELEVSGQLRGESERDENKGRETKLREGRRTRAAITISR